MATLRDMIPRIELEKLSPPTKTELNARRLIRQLYEDICGYTITREEDKAIRKARSLSTYGEITFASVRKIMKLFKVGKKDVVYDLGSGVGKMITQVGMTKKVKKAVGIELAQSRYEDAERVLTQVHHMGLLKTKNTKFLCGDILKTNLKDATLIYTCSTAFPCTFMDLLADKLSECKKGTKIVSLQPFDHMGKLQQIAKISLDMTWSRKVAVEVYER